jgi:hypothetical protein
MALPRENQEKMDTLLSENQNELPLIGRAIAPVPFGVPDLLGMELQPTTYVVR